MDRTIVIMRPGTFTSVEGQAVSFTAEDLAGVAAAYDPAADPAPLVVGHPQLDAPAYGWAKALRMDGDRLVADAERIEPAFAEAVKDGRYAKISSSFYPPDHPANPAPGRWYLKHIGFLGAAAPAVKGLGTVQFREAVDQAPLATFEQEEKITVTDKTVSLAEREKDIEAREAALREREAAATAAARAALHAANVSFAEGMVAEAKLAPAGKSLLVGVLDSLEAVETVSFGEAGELAPAAALKKLLSGAKPLVSLGEAAGAEKATTGAISFAAPSGYSVDPKGAEIHRRAKALQASTPNLGWMDAVRLAQG
ncbi:hypothetical protein GVO57_07400 [Sphingomonas changnyeongensis]|uniref:Peptidase n=1 Tax=Sphingomonas changnyeongensis TaxID=2698679 RepID=A0A7Z2S7U8_9SPHN|nr:hypothetical protein [Sphingomonas changnyeongensis]QHL90691.1 hypothetical protein GVO57_07400 [Sphingomonas changnyeongensis]